MLIIATGEIGPKVEPLIQDPVVVLIVLLAFLAILFQASKHAIVGRLFKVVPLLLFAYFVPTLLSNLNVIPLKSTAYSFVTTWFLPASLLLLTLSVDVPGIVRLGPKVLIVFLGATVGIVLGGPLAYLALGWLLPSEFGDQAWKGLAALSGSWIGGGANFVALKESVGASDDIIGVMIIVDVAVANMWMALLLFFAGRERQMDESIGADRNALEELKGKIESYQSEVSRPTSLADLLLLLALSLGTTAIATELSHLLPDVGEIIKQFTWVVIIVTAVGVGLSFTKLRRLEGAGASAVGSVFLYLLVATIGARGDFRSIDKAGYFFLIGIVWMAFHAIIVLSLRFLLRAPIFYAAVGSQANVGGAASAPVVAGSFHPSLSSVGALLAVGGYVLGTYAGLLCAFLMRLVHYVWHQ